MPKLSRWEQRVAAEFGWSVFEKGARCGARTRAGHPCQAKAMQNGRCRNHGGASTGPLTTEGRAAISQAQKARWERYRAQRSG